MKNEADWVTVSFLPGTNGTLDGTTSYAEILTGTKWEDAGITVPTIVANHGWTANGWDAAFAETINDNLTYTAQYVKDEADWVTIIFRAGTNGSLNTGDISIEDILIGTHFGDAVKTVPTPVANDGYHFTAWNSPIPANNVEVVGNMEFVANFAINEYTAIVNYVDEDTNEVIAAAKEVAVKHGETVNGADHVINIEDYVYTNADSKAITEDNMEVNVYYSADENHDEIPDKYQITVSYRAVNGTITANNGPFTLNKVDANGDYAVDGAAHLTAEQIATATANEGYHFVSWSPEVPTTEIELSEDTEFVANFAINEYTAIVNYVDEDTNEVIAAAKEVAVKHGETVNGADHVINIEDYVYTNADSKAITEDNMEVNVYYSADENHDEIPDKYQITVSYRAVNGTITANNGPFTLNKVDANGDYAVDGAAHLTDEQIAKASPNNGYQGGTWSPMSPTTTLDLTDDTTFTITFTATPTDPDEPNPGCPEGTVWDEAAQACLAPFVPGPEPFVPGPGPVNPGPEEEVIVEPETPEQGGTVTPTPTPEIEEIEEPEQPEVGHKGSWALINLIASLLGLLAALFLIFAKHQKDDDEEDQNQSAAMNEEDPEQLKRKRIYKWISGLTAVVSIIVFVLTENMRLPMILVDKWTLLMVVFFLINAVTLYLGRRWHENEDDEEQTQA